MNEGEMKIYHRTSRTSLPDWIIVTNETGVELGRYVDTPHEILRKLRRWLQVQPRTHHE